MILLVISVLLNNRRKVIANEDKNKPIMNEKIRSREVSLIDENGDNHGVVATLTALKMAQDADLDLVIISPNQEPPVAKILNYGKYKYDLEKKKLKLSIDVYDDFLIIADQKELKIAVDNLLRNAITYTEDGNTIEILCEKIENKNIFSMKNPYKEISQEEIEKLWIAFTKEDKARTRKFGGTGLGLSIIAAIMKKHDFSYGALYEDGKMKFYFYEERA